MIGEVVGNYRIVSELGRGGMGVVYAAEHVQLGKPVAVKMLLAQMASDPMIVQRFFNEARAASAIEHPGIIEIFDFGVHAGSAYIVMALLRGQSLDHRLLYGALPPLEGASLVAQVAAALSAAHACGIVHRDLKPDNIYLVPNELMPDGVQIKLLDFGIAKLADERQAGFKTQTGALIGTPAYMSPEQCMGRSDIDHRTDLYSLGCILFHVLTGRPPFLSDHGTGVMIAAHMRDPAPHPRSINPAIPDSLAAITMRLLEKDPAARFQTAAELRAMLVGAGAHAPVTRPGNVDVFGATMASMPIVSGTHAAPVTPAPYAHAAPSVQGIAHSPYAAPSVQGIAHSPTTVGGSAAQVMPPPPPARKGKAGLWIALGAVVLAGTAGAVGYAVTRDPSSTEDTSVAKSDPVKPVPASTPAEKPPSAPAGEPVKPTKPKAPTTPTSSLTPAACPDGQARSDDTQGNCCWKDQAWSTAKAGCVGTPSCPTGMQATGTDCLSKPGTVIAGGRPVVPLTPSGPPVVAPASFKLAAKVFKANGDIVVKFPSAVNSPPSSRSWVCIADVGAAPSAYSVWSYVDDHATTAVLRAPTKPGAYEVRLHTDYPTKPFNVKHVETFSIAAAGGSIAGPIADGSSPAQIAAAGPTPRASQTFGLAAAKVPVGSKARLGFPVAMHALKGEQFWVTIVAAGTADSSWGSYEYVADGARGASLAVPNKPGDYEIRLHANYPTKTTNVVFRRPITVE